jgi:hypothetical protein
MKRWSEDETILLQQEAESRARAGHSRTDIAHQLGVPLHTLARWAFEGRWREKDILAEQARARAEAMRQRLAAQRARETGIATRFGAVSRTALLEPAFETKSADANPADPASTDSAPTDSAPTASGPNHAGQHPHDRLREIWVEEEDCPPWADRAPQVKTPPWAPGGNNEDTESCALFLASDLMRQGLLVEAERALRFSRNWATAWERATQKWDKEDHARARRQEKQAIEEDLGSRGRTWASAAATTTAGTGGATE